MRPIGWGLVTTAIFFVLFTFVGIPTGALEHAVFGESGFYTNLAAFFLFVGIVSFPASLVIEFVNWMKED